MAATAVHLVGPSTPPEREAAWASTPGFALDQSPPWDPITPPPDLGFSFDQPGTDHPVLHAAPLPRRGRSAFAPPCPPRFPSPASSPRTGCRPPPARAHDSRACASPQQKRPFESPIPNERDERPAADQQRGHAGISTRSGQTTGANQWRTAGHRSDEPGNRPRSSDGDRGSILPSRRRLRARPRSRRIRGDVA